VNPKYQRLMEAGRQVVVAQRLFGSGSVQHKQAVATWRMRQAAIGVVDIPSPEWDTLVAASRPI
jgi:ribosomal protein L18E